MRVELYILEPLRRQCGYDGSCLVVAVDVLADAEIGVHTRKHRLNLLRTDAAVELTCLRFRASYNAIVDIHSIHLDVQAETFHSFRVVLAVELVFVELRTESRKTHPYLRNDARQKYGQHFCRDDKIMVIDISFVSYAKYHDPYIYLNKIIIDSILPYQMTDSGSDTVGLCKDGLVFLDAVPFADAALAVAMMGRVRIDAHLENIQKVFLVLSVIVFFDDRSQLRVCNILIDIREATAKVELDDVTVARETLAHLVDVAYHGILAGVGSHADAVVKRMLSHSLLKERTQAHVEIMVKYAS